MPICNFSVGCTGIKKKFYKHSILKMQTINFKSKLFYAGISLSGLGHLRAGGGKSLTENTISGA